jgi:hypothetical protein
LESFIENVKSDILHTAKVNTDTFDNLTPVERTALQNLRYNEDIIIKPADKGSAVRKINNSVGVVVNYSGSTFKMSIASFFLFVNRGRWLV